MSGWAFARGAMVLSIRMVTATVILALAMTLGVGLWLSWRSALADEQVALRALASAIAARSAFGLDETSEALTSLADDPKPHCAPDHVRLLHDDQVELGFAREIGVVVAGKVACSSDGLYDIPVPVPDNPGNGNPAYRVVPSPPSPMSDAAVSLFLQIKDHFAALDPSALIGATSLVPPHLGVAVMRKDMDRPLLSLGKVPPSSLSPAPAAMTNTVDGYLVIDALSADQPLRVIVAESLAHIFGEWWTDTLPLLALAGVSVLFVAFAGFLWIPRLTMPEAALRRALRRGEIFAVYQPIMDLATGRCVGAEALARWRRANGSTIPPETFVALAEASNQERALTKQVLLCTARDLGRFLRAHPDFQIGLNIAPEELHDDGLRDMLDATFKAAGIRPGQVTLEATERQLIDSEAAKAAVHVLRNIGYKLAIDDFGTGYASLRYLQTLEFDSLKIAQTFIKAIDLGAASSRVAPLIIEIAEALSLDVVAEGVETEAQAAYLRDRGVRFAQGWLFSKPLDAAALITFCERRVGPGAAA